MILICLICAHYFAARTSSLPTNSGVLHQETGTFLDAMGATSLNPAKAAGISRADAPAPAATGDCNEVGRNFRRSLSLMSQISTATSTGVTQDQSNLGSFFFLATPSAVMALECYEDALARLTSTSVSTRSSTSSRRASNSSSSSSCPDVNVSDDPSEWIDCGSDVGRPPAEVVSVNRNEMHWISLLGRGCYSNVHLVTDQRKEKLALKCLDPTRIASPDELVVAATDLAMEAIVLSSLAPHPHIIRLRGVCSVPFSQSYAEAGEGSEGYFLLLDVLTETLSDRLNRWRKDRRSSMTDQQGGRKTKRMSLVRFPRIRRHQLDVSKMYGRMETVARGVVCGMAYLHSQGIILRDLKPSNCGFDEDGKVRLFDFGMARQIKDCHAEEICGSPRYMAPEVMAGHGYTLKADVYSFGVLLYELCTLEVPFTDVDVNRTNGRNTRRNASKKVVQATTTVEDFQRLVVEQKVRPLHVDRIPCARTRGLIQDCWDSDLCVRPTFEEVAERLSEILA